MAFNLHANKKIKPFNKLLEDVREDGELSEIENPSTHEDLLDDDRDNKNEEVTTEARLEHTESKEDYKIIEKQLKHDKIGEIYVPTIQAFVEDLSRERYEKEYKPKENIVDKNHWTLEKSTQNKELPEWPKSPVQHDKPVLPNSPNRKMTEPLVGGIKKASINNVVLSIKSGDTYKYDSQILDILKKAESEGREINKQEKKQINELKKARTQAFLGDN